MKRAKGRFGLGVDAGGTYTDAVLYDFTQNSIVDKNKALTTKWNFSLGIDKALAGIDQDMLTEVDLVSVSTTLATNALVEGEGQKTALLLFGGENSDLLPNHSPKKILSGSLNINGQEVSPIDEEEIRRIAMKLVAEEGVCAFAVSGFAATINPAHELRAKEVIAASTGKFVCCGHEFSTQLNFAIRAQTAVLNARIIPRMMTFFQNLNQVLQQRGIEAQVLVVKGDGTLMAESVAMERPVETILSGPAASVAGARHLTGLKNGLVIDIGGTTTDTADIIDGEVAVCNSGAVVGGFTTHVRALDMTTVGLGGDSHIRLKDNKFILGPRRVAPLCWAGEVAGDGLLAALRCMARNPIHRQEQIIFVANEDSCPFTPTSEEKALMQLLHKHPHTVEMLAEELGKFSTAFLPLQRLEGCGVIQRCGLTPTDLLHLRGTFSKWDPLPARKVVEQLAKSCKMSEEEVVGSLMEQISNELALEIFRNQVFSKFSSERLADSDIFKHISHELISTGSSRYAMKIAFNHPIIGIGGPTPHFLPTAGNTLHARVIIPPNAEVANAVGAVTSHILIRQELKIRPENSGRFTVVGVAGTRSFPDLRDAQAWVESWLKDDIKQRAEESGNHYPAISFETKDQCATLNDGSSLFLERTVMATLKCAPEIVLTGNTRHHDRQGNPWEERTVVSSGK